MLIKLEDRPVDYKPFKHLNKYSPARLIREATNPQRMQQTFNLYLNDPIALASKQNQEKIALERRRKVLEDYHRLLAEGPSQEFDKLVSEHVRNLQALRDLDDEYDKNYLRLSEIRLDVFRSERQVKACTLRKQSFFSNIKYHYQEANAQPFSKSGLIFISLGIGIATIILGGVVLIPTIFTMLLPLPIVLIGLGIILTLVGLILTRMDQLEAEASYSTVNEKHQQLLAESKTIDELLLNIEIQMNEIDFVPMSNQPFDI